MNIELIVMTFPHQADADTILKAIQAMRKSPVLNLESSVLVTRNQDGQLIFCTSQESATAQESSDAQILLSLAELILGNQSEDAVRALTERGMDHRFVTEIERSMNDKASALFFLARENHVHDAGEMHRTLALFKGIIYETSLPPQVEAYLLGSLDNGLMESIEQKKTQ